MGENESNPFEKLHSFKGMVQFLYSVTVFGNDQKASYPSCDREKKSTSHYNNKRKKCCYSLNNYLSIDISDLRI